jgi:hypothetical protein
MILENPKRKPPNVPPERLPRGLLLAGVGRSMRALSRLADVAGFWTLDRTTITGRSAVILSQHTTPFRPMIVPVDDWSLSIKALEIRAATYAQISARQRRERFFKAGSRAPGRGPSRRALRNFPLRHAAHVGIRARPDPGSAVAGGDARPCEH